MFVSSGLTLHNLHEGGSCGITWRSCPHHEPDLCAALWTEYGITLNDDRLTITRALSPEEGETMITLPHTGLQVPHTGIRVTSLRQTDVGSGIAWSATLREGRVKLGTITNHGTGGMTLFYPDTSGARRALADFVDQCRDNTGGPVNEETVIDELTNEYEWARDVARAQKKGRYMVRFFDDIGIPGNATFNLSAPYPDYERALITVHRTIADLPTGTVRAQLWTGAKQGWVEYHRTPQSDDR
ncbi:hypothetical protein ACWGKS_21935 [Nocardiopsis sp. NPDC055879]